MHGIYWQSSRLIVTCTSIVTLLSCGTSTTADSTVSAQSGLWIHLPLSPYAMILRLDFKQIFRAGQRSWRGILHEEGGPRIEASVCTLSCE